MGCAAGDMQRGEGKGGHSCASYPAEQGPEELTSLMRSILKGREEKVICMSERKIERLSLSEANESRLGSGFGGGYWGRKNNC